MPYFRSLQPPMEGTVATSLHWTLVPVDFNSILIKCCRRKERDRLSRMKGALGLHKYSSRRLLHLSAHVVRDPQHVLLRFKIFSSPRQQIVLASKPSRGSASGWREPGASRNRSDCIRPMREHGTWLGIRPFRITYRVSIARRAHLLADVRLRAGLLRTGW